MPGIQPLRSVAERREDEEIRLWEYHIFCVPPTPPQVNEDCVICLEALYPDASEAYNVVKVRRCAHVFHKSCLESWIENRDHADDVVPKCPFCRKELFQFQPPSIEELTAALAYSLLERCNTPEELLDLLRATPELDREAADDLHALDAHELPRLNRVALEELRSEAPHLHPVALEKIYLEAQIRAIDEIRDRNEKGLVDLQADISAVEQTSIPRADRDYVLVAMEAELRQERARMMESQEIMQETVQRLHERRRSRQLESGVNDGVEATDTEEV